MIYKLLAVNIDGTLLQSNGRLTKATKEAIAYVQSKGVAVVLVTSRNIKACKKVATVWKNSPMIVAVNGGYVGQSIDKPMFVKRISEQATEDLVSFLENINCQFTLNFEDKHVANRVDLPENFLGKAVMYINEQKLFSQLFVDSVSEYIQTNASTPLSIDILFASQSDKQNAVKEMNRLFMDLSIMDKENNRLLITPSGVNKWGGLKYLADYYQISKNEIVAIGDDDSDLEMIVNAGVGVAMGNAEEEIKRRANWIARTNDDEGVAYTVREVFRKQYQLDFLEKMNLLR